MASPESRVLRATFARPASPPVASPQTMRQEWEHAVDHSAVPPSVTATPVASAGIVGEWLSSPEAASHQVLLFLHGGGYNAGSCVTHRELGARLCVASGLRVFVLDYRLAPEHPFPAALEDATAAYRWLLAQGVRSHNIVIGGDSSGGGLALATLVALRDARLPLPAAGVFLSPWADLTLAGSSMVTHAERDPLVTRAALQRAAAWYAGQTNPAHPLLSPLFANLAGLPPLLLQVGSDEMLLSDATRVGERARVQGVAATVEVWDGMWHVWHAFAAHLPEGQAAIEQIGAFIQQQLAQAVRSQKPV